MEIVQINHSLHRQTEKSPCKKQCKPFSSVAWRRSWRWEWSEPCWAVPGGWPGGWLWAVWADLLSQDQDVGDLADRGEDLEERGQDSQAVRPGQVVEIRVLSRKRGTRRKWGRPFYRPKLRQKTVFFFTEKFCFVFTRTPTSRQSENERKIILFA